MQFSNFESIERIYVVNNDSPPLIDIRTFETHKLHTLSSNKQVNMIGCAKKFVHEIQLKTRCDSLCSKTSPCSDCATQVTEELKRLVKEDIIEPVDSREWVFNVVVVQNPSGDVRLCLDLREMNKAIVTDHYLCRIQKRSSLD